jgi:CheY-like chemotaxis protein
MRNVLVIDDDPEHAEIVAALLRRRGFSVAIAADGATGIALARKQQPDAIVLDYFMPSLDGFATAEKLRACRRLKNVPIVFVSAWAEKAAENPLSGPVKWLGKPFRAAQLAQALEEAIAH